MLWTVLSGDYDQTKSSDDILDIVRPHIRGGAIQVFHDTVTGGGEKLPGIIGKIAATAHENSYNFV